MGLATPVKRPHSSCHLSGSSTIVSIPGQHSLAQVRGICLVCPDQKHSSSRRAPASVRYFLKSHSGGPSKAPLAFHAYLRFLLRCYYPSRASRDLSKCTGSSSSGDLYSCLCRHTSVHPPGVSDSSSPVHSTNSSHPVSVLNEREGEWFYIVGKCIFLLLCVCFF